MSAPQPWHAGERALQQRAGVAERMAENGPRVLRDHMPQQHRDFYAELPLLLASSLDSDGQPCASLLAGAPGFAFSPEPRTLRVQPAWTEAWHEPLHEGAPIGLLGLQAHSGRRNRLNGWISQGDAQGFDLTVAQSFGNCPRYIRRRRAEFVAQPREAKVSELAGLDEPALRIVRTADTLFIATAHPLARTGRDPAHGLDVSHRGGPAGFVHVAGADTLELPDYDGNGFFNTLGNLQVEPRCSLLFIDFATGDRLHLRARGELHWNEEGRVLVLRVTSGWHARGGIPVRWTEPQE
jgi:predicted pyridoxine 5'-phosphate oxidase superfamily flavin-nucleotide-binding protein